MPHCTCVLLLEPGGHAYPLAHRAPPGVGDVFAIPAQYQLPAHALQLAAPELEYVPGAHDVWVADVEPAGHA